MMKKLFLNYILLASLVVLTFSCKTKDDLEAFKEAKYSLAGINEIKLNGINLLEKKRPEDFSFSEAAILFTAFSENDLRASSNLGLNVELEEGSQDRAMKVTQLKWQLLMDGKHVLNGIVSEPVELKHGLNTISVSSPVTFAAENGQPSLNSLLRLVAVVAEKDKTKRPNLTLQIKPTIQTSVGPFELPAFINIKQ